MPAFRPTITGRRSNTCARCAEVGYNNKLCENSERYKNCKGDHTADSLWPKLDRSKGNPCQNYTKLSDPEARNLVESRTPSDRVSCFSVLKQ